MAKALLISVAFVRILPEQIQAFLSENLGRIQMEGADVLSPGDPKVIPSVTDLV